METYEVFTWLFFSSFFHSLFNMFMYYVLYLYNRVYKKSRKLYISSFALVLLMFMNQIYVVLALMAFILENFLSYNFDALEIYGSITLVASMVACLCALMWLADELLNRLKAEG